VVVRHERQAAQDAVETGRLGHVVAILAEVCLVRDPSQRRERVAAAGWLLVELAGIAAAAAAVPLLVLAIVFGSAGECLYDSIFGPFVADLAPESRTGRYMAASGFAWQLGFITAPAAAGGLLSVAPYALWPVVAGGATGAAIYALRLEPLLPEDSRLTPRRELRPSRGPLSRPRSAPDRPASSASASGSPRPPRR
jgi:MFS family permease